MSQTHILFEPLGGHPREAFSCKYRPVQHFFRKWAEESHLSYTQRVFVACAEERGVPIGFYSLTLMTFVPGMDEDTEVNYKERRVPTIYMGAIARDRKLSEPGFGSILLDDAFRRCLEVRESVGVYAMSLHAANEQVAKIYEGYGFSRFANGEVMADSDGNPMPAMFIKLADVDEAFKEAERA